MRVLVFSLTLASNAIKNRTKEIRKYTNRIERHLTKTIFLFSSSHKFCWKAKSTIAWVSASSVTSGLLNLNTKFAEIIVDHFHLVFLVFFFLLFNTDSYYWILNGAFSSTLTLCVHMNVGMYGCIYMDDRIGVWLSFFFLHCVAVFESCKKSFTFLFELMIVEHEWTIKSNLRFGMPV